MPSCWKINFHQISYLYTPNILCLLYNVVYHYITITIEQEVKMTLCKTLVYLAKSCQLSSIVSAASTSSVTCGKLMRAPMAGLSVCVCSYLRSAILILSMYLHHTKNLSIKLQYDNQLIIYLLLWMNFNVRISLAILVAQYSYSITCETCKSF